MAAWRYEIPVLVFNSISREWAQARRTHKFRKPCMYQITEKFIQTRYSVTSNNIKVYVMVVYTNHSSFPKVFNSATGFVNCNQ